MRSSFLSISALALALLASPLAPTRSAADTSSHLTLSCPGPVTADNAPDACAALVPYPGPTVTGGNGTVTVVCSPPSGSLFPVGTTTVQCTAKDPSGQMASCQFTVTVRDVQLPTCSLCFFNPHTSDCTSNLTLVANSRAGAPFPFGSVAFVPRITDNCPNPQGDVTRSDGLGLDALYPVGTTMLTEVVTDAAGNSSQCMATITVLPAFVKLASQVYALSHVPAPGDTVIDLSGPADVRLDVNYPGGPVFPGGPVRVHTLINLHDVVATWNGVQYHATNNVEADLSSNQLSPISLTVPGIYKFEAHGKAAVHSFSLNMPLQVVITAGSLSTAIFAPQFVATEPGGGRG